MAHYDLTTPLTEADVRQLQLEDTVSLSGVIFGIRDATQIRIFDQGIPPPVSMDGGVCLHTAPGVLCCRALRGIPDAGNGVRGLRLGNGGLAQAL